jgi:hypothetical protein
LLKTKAKVQFDRAVTDRSKPFFPVFQDFYPAQFQPCFSVFAVRSAEGRNWKGLVFSGQIASLPIANCLFYCLSSLEGKHLIYHLFAPPVKYKNFLVVGSVWYLRTFNYVVIPKGVSEPRVLISGRVALRDLAF